MTRYRLGDLNRQRASLQAVRVAVNEAAWVEGLLDEVRARMNKHGYAIISVADVLHPFSYTVGLTNLQHPELIITGLPADDAQVILSNAAQLVLDGRYLIAGDRLDGIIAGYPVVIAGPAATAGTEYKMRIALRVFAQVAWALQVVYPDADGRFPWDAGYSMTIQPLLAPPPH
jgi:hypothetical protein